MKISRPHFKMFSASVGERLRPLAFHQRLCPWTSLGAHPPDRPRNRLALPCSPWTSAFQFLFRSLCILLYRDIINCDPTLQTICCHHRCSLSLKLKCTKTVFGRGSAVDPAGELTTPRPYNRQETEERGTPPHFPSLRRIWRLDGGPRQSGGPEPQGTLRRPCANLRHFSRREMLR